MVETIKDKHSWTLVKAVEADFTQLPLTMGESAELHFNLCRGDLNILKGQCERGEPGVRRESWCFTEREVKSHKALVTLDVTVPAVYELAVTEVRILSSHRSWETEALHFLMMVFQTHGSQVLEKDASELEETHIHNCKLFLSKCSKRRKSGLIIRHWLEKIVSFLAVLNFLREAF